MRVVILAGGLGTRLSEKTTEIPKPMIDIGGGPILWHILRHYAHFGFDDFYLALGYKGEVIRRYFDENTHLNGCRINLVDTKIQTNTGGRVRQLESHLKGETFMLTYGDGVSNLDLAELLRFHKSHGLLATVTAVHPPPRFGSLLLKEHKVKKFSEKSPVVDGWINGGFFVFEPGIFQYLKNDATSLEADALDALARDGQLAAFRHNLFWQCMDTLRDVRHLRQLWDTGTVPWKVWN